MAQVTGFKGAELDLNPDGRVQTWFPSLVLCYPPMNGANSKSWSVAASPPAGLASSAKAE